jgi:hypothetical protein
MSDAEKTKEAILEIFRRDDTTAPEALFVMSVLAARIIVNTSKGKNEIVTNATNYFNEITDAISASSGCTCEKCRKAMN